MSFGRFFFASYFAPLRENAFNAANLALSPGSLKY